MATASTTPASIPTVKVTDHEAQQIERSNATGLQPIVFVHGLWLLPSSWDRWATFVEEAGYTALTPGWPDDPATVDEANTHPEVFANKTIGMVADHVEQIIRGLKRKPAVIGHSFGGLLAQILAGRGLSAATVAVDPAPFRGVLPLPISALKAGFPVLGNPANRHRAVPLTFEQFRFAFANAVSERRGQGALRKVRRAGAGRTALPGRGSEPQSVDRGESRYGKSGSRSAAHHLGREGSHGAVGDRERVVPSAAEESRADGDRGDQRSRTRAHDRQWLARGGDDGARVREAFRVAAAVRQVRNGRGLWRVSRPFSFCPGSHRNSIRLYLYKASVI